SFSGSASADVQAGATLNLHLGIDLSPLQPGENLLNRFFLAAGDGVTATASVNATDLNLSAAVGNLAVGIEHGSTPSPLTFTIGLTLQDPNSDGKILLSELGAAAASGLTLSAGGSVSLPLKLDGVTDLLGVSLPATPTIQLGFSASASTFD